MSTSAETPTPDPVFVRVSESCTRLFAGQVHRSTMKELQKLVRSRSGGYPWEEVVERLLADPVETPALTRHALQRQRDWILRGGRETPGKGLRGHAKTLVAILLARLIFMAVSIPAVILVLVLANQVWPWFDIYVVRDWLHALAPRIFQPR